MTRPIPIRLRDNLTLSLDERGYRTFAIFVLWTTVDAGQWDYAVVDDDADLRVGMRLA